MNSLINFNQNSTDNTHYRKLKKEIDILVKKLPKYPYSIKIGVTFLCILLYIVIYILALNNIENVGMYYFLFAMLGIASLFIFLNIIHDAVHSQVFKKKWLNNVVLIVFDFMGANSYIWKKRHINLHHNYQNIMGCDSDIEQAGLFKVFPHDKPSSIMKYQHWLIFLFYPLYLVNWVLIRDFKDFFLKDRLIRKVVKIPFIEYVKLFVFKIIFIFYMIVLPIMLGQKVSVAIISLFVMLIVGGVFSLAVLLTPHANIKNEFPLPNDSGKINVSWFQHQFITTNDVNLNNWFTRHLMGNFNFHIAHHLFPNVSPVYAAEVTQVIKKYANENGYPYRSFSIGQALYYHFKLIKANALNFNLFEEDM